MEHDSSDGIGIGARNSRGDRWSRFERAGTEKQEANLVQFGRDNTERREGGGGGRAPKESGPKNQDREWQRGFWPLQPFSLSAARPDMSESRI